MRFPEEWINAMLYALCFRAGPTFLGITVHALCDFNVKIGVLNLKSAPFF